MALETGEREQIHRDILKAFGVSTQWSNDTGVTKGNFHVKTIHGSGTVVLAEIHQKYKATVNIKRSGTGISVGFAIC